MEGPKKGTPSLTMPELPEVETIRRDLEKNIVGKKITGADFLWPGILKCVSAREFVKQVVGQRIVSVNRRAKNIDVTLTNDKCLLFHMKMTGHLIYTDADWKVDKEGKWIRRNGVDSPLYDPLNQYIRAIFWLDGGKILAFSDLRKFAYLKVLDKKELENSYESYGPEPFSKEFNTEYLKNVFANKKTPIKKIIMDQKRIAGIGNIYADEILWESRIHPLTPGGNLNDKDIFSIYDAILEILKRAVKMRGTSTSDFRDIAGKKGGYGKALNAYRLTGKPCKRDNTKIERIVVGGRGTHFCPTCQKLK
jgi:formamidopyrimidine-DNA glycosylase